MEPFQTIGRPLFRPCYSYAASEPLEPWTVLNEQPEQEFGNKFCGRLVCMDGVMTGPEGRFPEEWLDLLGPTDIVYVGLYDGAPQPDKRGSGLVQKEHYAHNVAMLREIAPRVEGISVGNCGAELAYHHLICGPELAQKEFANNLCIEFVRRVGGLIAEAGGTPVFGTMDRDVLIDAYHCHGNLARTIDSYGGWQIVYDEWFLPQLDCITGGAGVHSEEIVDRAGNIVALDAREEFPFPTLLRYMRRWRVDCAIGYQNHLGWNYDAMLTQHGASSLVLANFWNDSLSPKPEEAEDGT